MTTTKNPCLDNILELLESILPTIGLKQEYKKYEIINKIRRANKI